MSKKLLIFFNLIFVKFSNDFYSFYLFIGRLLVLKIVTSLTETSNETDNKIKRLFYERLFFIYFYVRYFFKDEITAIISA